MVIGVHIDIDTRLEWAAPEVLQPVSGDYRGLGKACPDPSGGWALGTALARTAMCDVVQSTLERIEKITTRHW
jgi:hypothetical protein